MSLLVRSLSNRMMVLGGVLGACGLIGSALSSDGRWLHETCGLPYTVGIDVLAIPFLLGIGMLVGLLWAMRLAKRHALVPP